MTSFSPQEFKKYPSAVGNFNIKSQFAYQTTRGLTAFFNTLQMTLAESYIHGLEIPDHLLIPLLNTFVSTSYKYFPTLLVFDERILQESEILAENSQELMKIQYNLPEKLFATMLEADDLLYPKYTMALWEKGAFTLKQAQTQMLDDVIEKIGIQNGDEILDLGCGWGSAAHYILAKFPDVRVTALNLSHEQCNYMRKKMQDAKSALGTERFTLVEGDFNQAVFESKFDKIILIGLFEHIGNLTKSLQKVAALLKENGRVFLHIISTRLPYNAWSPFIDKYIFPRARAWHFEAIPRCDQDLKTIQKWYINGHNYARTLTEWLNNFDRNQSYLKTLDYGMNYDQFRRIWRLYLLWCIAYFNACDGEVLGNGQYLMMRA